MLATRFRFRRSSKQSQSDQGGGGDAFHECVDFHNRNFRRMAFAFIQGELKNLLRQVRIGFWVFIFWGLTFAMNLGN